MKISFSEAVSTYLIHCETEKQNGARWLTFQRATLKKFQAFLSEHGIRALGLVQPFHLSDFLAGLALAGESTASRTRRAVIIRAVARWAEQQGRIGAAPLSRSVVRASKRLPPELPSRQELELLIVRAKKPILRDAFELLLLTGLRRGELLALRWSDLFLKAGTGHVRATKAWTPKSGKARSFPLNKRAVAILKARQKGPATPGPFLTWTGPLIHESTLTKAFKVLVTKAGRPNLRLHDLRHAFGTFAVNDYRIDIREVQAVMGHASIQTTEIYAHARETAAQHCAMMMSRKAG